VRERVRVLRQLGETVEIIAAGEPGCSDRDVSRIEAGGLFYAGGAPDALEDTHTVRRILAWGKALGFSVAMFQEVVRRRGRWQAVESHWLVPCGLIASVALPGIPHRSHVHGGDLFLLRRLPLGDSLGRIFCRTRPQLVFASAHLRKKMEELLGTTPESLGAECTVEAAPFDRSLFYPRPGDERARLRCRLGFIRPTILAAGRLVPIKGFDVLISAVAEIPRAARPDLAIAGDGPERQALARQARARAVGVRFLGTLEPVALAEAMAAADLLVHPCRVLPDGRSEGMPLVVREALACTLPVVASASGGLAELDGSPGLRLVEPDNPTALAAAIESAFAARAPTPCGAGGSG
jgi:glycosyltransferase involved in cell wall biosynthesis